MIGTATRESIQVFVLATGEPGEQRKTHTSGKGMLDPPFSIEQLSGFAAAHMNLDVATHLAREAVSDEIEVPEGLVPQGADIASDSDGARVECGCEGFGA